jgi:hypothetical protein
MTVAEEKVKQSSIKYFLARVTPARDITSTLVSEGGGVYALSGLTQLVSSLERNGTALTQVQLTTPTVNDTWSYFSNTGILRVKLASAPHASTNLIVMYYRLHFSDEIINTYTTPTDNTTESVDWEPWIINSPTITASFSDHYFGVLSIQTSSIQLRNPDRFFQGILSNDDSFFKKQVEIWAGITNTSVTNVVKVFTGFSSGLTGLTRESVTLQVNDSFGKLQASAYMGDTFEDSHSPESNLNIYSYTPIPYVFTRSAYALAGDGVYNTFSVLKNIDYRYCERAIYAGVIAEIPSSSNNLGPWIIGRTGSGGFKTTDTGSVVEVYYNATLTTSSLIGRSGAEPTMFELVYAPSTVQDSNLEIGDTVIVTHATINGGSAVRGVVCDIETDFANGDRIKCLSTTDLGNSDLSRTTGLTFTENQAPALVIESGGENRPLIAGTDYSLASLVEQTTASGNKYFEVTFTTGTYFGTARSPSAVGLYYRVTTADAIKPHAAALKKVVDASGLPTNAASFTAADAALAVNCAFTIPLRGESGGIKDYAYYCQKILQSTLGYLVINSSGEAVYNLLDAPSTGTEISDDNTSNVSTEIDYSNIVSELIPSNPHIPKEYNSSISVKARYLHSGDSKKDYVHVLEDISPRINDILAFKSNPIRKYKIRGVGYELIEEILGGDLSATLSELIGSTTGNVKITSIELSRDGISLECSDFLGL